MIEAGAGFEVRNANELRAVLKRLLDEPDALRKASDAVRSFVRERGGATGRTVADIMSRIT